MLRRQPEGSMVTRVSTCAWRTSLRKRRKRSSYFMEIIYEIASLNIDM
jgi:hypothetical protein